MKLFSALCDRFIKGMRKSIICHYLSQITMSAKMKVLLVMHFKLHITVMHSLINDKTVKLSGSFDTFLEIMISTGTSKAKEVAAMKGYSTANGYMGLVDGRYMLFACEEDYLEYLED